MTASSIDPTSSRAPVCPQCDSQVTSGARYCGSCGVDLTFAALMAERKVLARIPTRPDAPLAAESIFPRIGDYLLEAGVISRDQLDAALAHQTEHTARGDHRTLGQTLIELGVLSRETLDQVLTQMTQDLQNALLESNRDLEQRVHERTAELHDALEKLAELNQLKVNFVSNVSHELRTPLGQIKGYVGLLADGSLGDLAAEQKDALTVTIRATERLERLIDDLIQFTLSLRGELTLQREPVSLPELTARLLEISQTRAQRKQVRLEADVSASLPRVDADRDRLHWVLFQLLDNAIKFTPAGGQVKLSARQHNKTVCLSVSDTGIGIPAHRLPELFTPFHQLDGSSTRRYGGTGLGLALAWSIVEAHGASISVDSREGQGSTFYFYLPLA